MTTYEKLVKGATKIKMAPPKPKYIEPILLGTTNPDNFHEIVSCLDRRLHDTAFTISYKSLITLHLMLNEGEKTITVKYLNKHLEVFENLRVKASHMDSVALENYNEYLKVRCEEYKPNLMGKDFIREGETFVIKYFQTYNNNNFGKTEQNAEKLLIIISSLERIIVQLLKNKYSQFDLSNNDLLMTCFKLLIKDLLILYQALNESIITILEGFFELNHELARKTLKLYKRFVNLTDEVVKYLKMGKSCGLKIPIIKHITTKLVNSLEDHLQSEELTSKNGNAGNTTNTNTNTTITSTSTAALNSNVPPNNNNNNNNNNKNGLSPREQLERIRRQKEVLEQQLKQTSTLIPQTPQINQSPSMMSNNGASALTSPVQPQHTNNPFLMDIQQSTGQQFATGQQQTMTGQFQQPAMTGQFQQPAMNGQVQQQQQQPQQQQQQQPQQLHPQFTQHHMQHQPTMPQIQENGLMNTQTGFNGTINNMASSNGLGLLQQAHTFSNLQMQQPQQSQEFQAPKQVVRAQTTGSNNPFSMANVQEQNIKRQDTNPFSLQNYGTEGATQQHQTQSNPFSIGNTPAAQLPVFTNTTGFNQPAQQTQSFQQSQQPQLQQQYTQPQLQQQYTQPQLQQQYTQPQLQQQYTQPQLQQQYTQPQLQQQYTQPQLQQQQQQQQQYTQPYTNTNLNEHPSLIDF